MKFREQALWWLATAERDLERAKRALREDDRAASTFWSQQAAEKALKALLLALKGWFPKTHSLKRLLEELPPEITFERADELAELTAYYYISRYPDALEGVPDESISRSSAERAVKLSSEVVRRAKEIMDELAGEDTEVGQ